MMYEHGNGMQSPTGKWGLGTAYYRNYKGWNIFGYEIAPASLCIPSCNGDYMAIWERMATNQQVQDMRKLYNADLVVYMHNSSGFRNGNPVNGVATIPQSEFEPTENAVFQNAVVNYHAGENAFVHEVFHLLGADHSKYNTNRPSYHTGKAYVNVEHYHHQVLQAVVRHPYKTFMAYQSACRQLASHAVLDCNEFDTLSTANDYYDFEGKIYNIGGAFDDNYWTMYRMMPRSASWSHHYNKP